MDPSFCELAGKVSYSTRSLAKLALAGLADRYKGEDLRVYRCSHCWRFHLGRQGKLKHILRTKRERSHNIKWRIGYARPDGL
jgi:hypothetical protein